MLSLKRKKQLLRQTTAVPWTSPLKIKGNGATLHPQRQAREKRFRSVEEEEAEEYRAKTVS